MPDIMKGTKLQKHFSIVATASEGPDKTISVGTIIDQRRNTNKPLSIGLDGLKKHVLISGVTGSGKTNTCFEILRQLCHHQIPFLVIQPAKSDYRQLMLTSRVFRGVGRVYTLGNETIAPFRVNPFEVPKGVKIQTHIDALLSVFNASFEMYAPMPQVLDTAICELYRAHGWDLAQNKNMRIPDGINPGDPDCPDGIYPTMSDLYEIIDPIIESFGYSERIGPDVRAALLARIGSLISGAKGKMFARRCSVSPEILFSQPVVIELQEMFNDNEKSFFAGILLLFLYHYRKLHGLNDRLQHVLLIEDAHRLLSKELKGTDNAPRGVFAQLFGDMLSEVGSYGEGVILSTQAPASLLPEALSNTNVKICHRLLTHDDVSAIAGPNYLDDYHKHYIATLGIGQAVFYAENMLQPYNVAIKHDKASQLSASTTINDSDVLVSRAMKKFVTVTKGHGSKVGEQNGSIVCDYSMLVANDQGFRNTFNRYVLTTLRDLTQFVKFRPEIVHEVQRIIGGRARLGDLTIIMWNALVLATSRYLERKGEDNFWYYNEVREQEQRWLGLLEQGFLPSEGGCRLDIAVLERWRDDFLELLKRDQGPYPTCGLCTSKCVYRFEVSEIVRDPKVKFDYHSTINRDDGPASESAAWFCRLLTERLIWQEDVDLSYCLAVHLIKDQQLSTDAQLVLLYKVRTALENPCADGEGEASS